MVAMGEKRQPPFAHAAGATPATHASALALSLAPSVANEIALAYHVIAETIRRSRCSEDRLASMMTVTGKAMLMRDAGHIKPSNQVLNEPAARRKLRGPQAAMKIPVRAIGT